MLLAPADTSHSNFRDGAEAQDTVRERRRRSSQAFPGGDYERSDPHPAGAGWMRVASFIISSRSEEHTSELQSLRHLVCRLLLEKKKRQGEDYERWTVRTRRLLIMRS